METLAAYALSFLVLTLEGLIISRRYDSLLKLAIDSGTPVNLSPRLKRIQAVGDVSAGIACGLVFGLIVPEAALFHCAILAVLALCASLAISSFIHVRHWPKADAKQHRLASQRQDLLYVVLPFPAAIWVSANLVLIMASRW